jgi:hypothetical protein
MTEVMKAWLIARTACAVQTRMEPNLLESSLKYVNGDGSCVPPHKERCVGAPRASLSTTAVFGKHLKRLGSDRHEPSFEELRISDGKNAAGKIDIAYRQRECF